MNTKLNHFPDWAELARQANWSVSKLAKLCGVSTRTLERHFVKSRGKLPKAWLTEQRQKQAMKFLRDGYPVKETAARMGYQHATTFTREFKKHCGLSPTNLYLLSTTALNQRSNVL